MNFFAWPRRYLHGTFSLCNSSISKKCIWRQLGQLLGSRRSQLTRNGKAIRGKPFPCSAGFFFFSFTKIELLPSVLHHKQAHLPSARIMHVMACNRLDLQYQNKEDTAFPSQDRYSSMYFLFARSSNLWMRYEVHASHLNGNFEK